MSIWIKIWKFFFLFIKCATKPLKMFFEFIYIILKTVTIYNSEWLQELLFLIYLPCCYATAAKFSVFCFWIFIMFKLSESFWWRKRPMSIACHPFQFWSIFFLSLTCCWDYLTMKYIACISIFLKMNILILLSSHKIFGNKKINLPQLWRK